MFDLIINCLFDKKIQKRKSNCTIIKNRDMLEYCDIKESHKNKITALSKYFRNVKGLNVKERLKSAI